MSARDFGQFVSRRRLLDGAWATRFYGRGMLPGSSAELFMARNPERVVELGSEYLQAGAEALMTNSFQAHRYGLLRAGAEDRAAELAELSATLARQAAGQDAMVFGSIGPSGRVLLAEEVTGDRLFEAFGETADALEWGGADALVLETFSEMEELRIAYRATRRATQLPVVICMSFDAGDGLYTQLGIRPEQLVDEARRLGADAVGANCGIGTESAIAVARRLVSRTDLPVWIKANAGLPHQSSGGVLTWPEGPEAFARFAVTLREMGVRMIGGCCGTGPQHIRAMHEALQGR